MTSNCPKKRQRSSNFSKKEEICLLEHIEKYKNVIENKTTNKVSQFEKENAWLKVLNEFNSKNVQTNRTMEQIKSKYDNLKTKTRKEVAEKKKYIKQTGGGSPINYDLDITTEAVLRIINLKTVIGLENNIDSDAHNTENSVYNSKENTDPQTCTEHVSEGITHSSSIENNDTNLESIIVDFHNVGENQNTEHDVEVQPIINNNLNPKKVPKDSTSWSSYTPKKLKMKPDKKLRQIRTNNSLWEAKENFYKRKTEILEKTFEEESRMRKRREEREQKEHEKKMRVLDMEIILKEKQLQEHMY